jgi:hypothetical protein
MKKRIDWCLVASIALLLMCGVIEEAHCQLSDAPQPQPTHTPFFAAWHKDVAKPLRTNKEVFTSKTFITSQAAMWGSAWAEYRYTKNSPTLRPRAKGGELAADMLLPLIGATGLHYVADKFVWRPIGILAEAYVTVIQSHSATTGRFH